MLKKVGMAALVALAMAGVASATITDADARDYREDGWRGGGHHGQYGWRGGYNRHRDFHRSYAHGDCRTIIIRHDDGSVRSSGVADNRSLKSVAKKPGAIAGLLAVYNARAVLGAS